jgi:hypothetical protein
MLIKSIDFDSAEGRYLLACARVRGLAVTSLVSRLLSAITRDELVLAILDDDSQLADLQRGEHKFKDRTHEGQPHAD